MIFSIWNEQEKEIFKYFIDKVLINFPEFENILKIKLEVINIKINQKIFYLALSYCI